MKSWWSGRRLAWSLRRALRERESLRARPWEEEIMHWAKDGSLHGHFLPPVGDEGVRGRRRLSVTSDGWCPAWSEEVQRQFLTDALGGSGEGVEVEPEG